MPGVALNLDLPSVTDTMAVMVAKTRVALSTIQDDLVPKLVPAEMNINAALSANGNAITGLGSVGMVGGNTPVAAGSIYYANGEFYAIDSTATVKLTSAGGLAIAGAKGIGGDYGNVANSALVYYDSASGEYRFFSSNGTSYGTVVTGSLVLKNANGFAPTYLPAAGQAANYQITVPPALPTGTALLQTTTAGVQTYSNTMAAATPIILKTTGNIQHDNYVVNYTPMLFDTINVSGGGATNNGALGGVVCPASSVTLIRMIPLDSSKTISSIELLTSGAANAVTYALNSQGGFGAISAIAGATVSSTQFQAIIPLSTASALVPYGGMPLTMVNNGSRVTTWLRVTTGVTPVTIYTISEIYFCNNLGNT
jgi:hypothetical protein